jgi:D-sedoheptulose 7-phosphate isomerase
MWLCHASKDHPMNVALPSRKPTLWLDELSLALQATTCRVARATASLDEGLRAAQQELIDVRERRGSLWWIGNGGSASMCSHFSQDSLNKLGIRSVPLSDTSLLTCMANDFGYENVYKRPLDT